MATKLNGTTAENVLDAVDAQSARPSRITVKEAALRLCVSKSTAYRIDRTNGPFRFIVEGRRIFIDSASFESHLANIRGIRADDCPLQVESVLPCHEPAEGPEMQSQIDELQVNTVATAIPSGSLPDSRSGGQRELTMRQCHQPFIVFYVS